jgi:hypothetical protein
MFGDGDEEFNWWNPLTYIQLWIIAWYAIFYLAYLLITKIRRKKK